MAAVSIPFGVYREKVLGCWLGKSVGGTLGGPYEGQAGPLALSFYDPVPDAMLPNDDLDLQIVWLETLRRHGLPADRRLLANAWLEHIHVWPDEYGVASRNLTRGIYPSVSGAFDNNFTAGMGAAIRTELWACLAPGDPELAVLLATEDACVDHAGEGLHAAVYLAALESMAFVESDQTTLLDTAASFIPPNSRVAVAIDDTRAWWNETGDVKRVRERVLARHGRENFTDVAQNLAFIVLGWLSGGGDFGASICDAVNCGMDTDCTGATLGALLGILNPSGITPEWLEPIGRALVLSPGIVGMHPPRDLDELTDQVAELARKLLEHHSSAVSFDGWQPPISGCVDVAPARACHPFTISGTPPSPREALIATEPIAVRLTYPEGIALRPGQEAALTIRLGNPGPSEQRLHLRCRVPDGWTVKLDHRSFEVIPLEPASEQMIELRVTPPGSDRPRPYRNPLDLRFDVDGLTWTVTAGLPTTTPWRRWALPSMVEGCPELPVGADVIEATSSTISIPDGAHALCTEVKLPYAKTLRTIAQCGRLVRVFVDGETALAHDGAVRVPAIHRCGTSGADHRWESGWRRVTIVLSPGGPDDLFFCLGDGESWDWMRDVEWRLP